MGILVLMLTLAGQVMNFTVKATGQAKALTEVNQVLRTFERSLREDFQHVRPGESIILIQGNPINAYWTPAGKEGDVDADPVNGYPHVRDPEREDPSDPTRLNPPRADILMFFTSRRASNYVQYDYRTAKPGAKTTITSGVQQVVYGHADFIEYTADGSDDIVARFPPDPEESPPDPQAVFSLPASRWHLARRVVHLLPLHSDPPPFTANSPKWGNAIPGEQALEEDDGDPDVDLLGNPAFLTGKTDVISGFDFEDSVLVPSDGSTGSFPLYWPQILDDVDYPLFARSRLDPTPPPLLVDRLGHYFLPHCASFKVEWALDLDSDFVGGRLRDEKEFYWFDPGADDPLAPLEDRIEEIEDVDSERRRCLLELAGAPVGGDILNREYDERYSLRARFSGHEDHFDVEWHSHDYGDNKRPNLVVFAASRRRAAQDDEVGELVPEDVFPIALRITVDLFDDQGRFERPIRHVIVVPVGG